MLSAFTLYVCGYPTVPNLYSTIGTLEKRRSKSFRTKDPSRFDYSLLLKIETILTPFYYWISSYLVINSLDYLILIKEWKVTVSETLSNVCWLFIKYFSILFFYFLYDANHCNIFTQHIVLNPTRVPF